MFFTCGVCKGQNLVPNGDFEQYSNCPWNIGQLDSLLFWFNPSIATPDYYNQCSSTVVNVPNSGQGYQLARSGGAYSGIVLWQQNADYREYIEVPLTTTLIANTCYHFEMYVNAANIFRYATDDFGVYFSDTLISATHNNPLPYIPQLDNNTGYITDTLNWILVDGNYTALGGENYLIIGNFKDDSNTDTILVNGSGMFSSAYIYIDDISLIPCINGVKENNLKSEINLYPNPMTDKLHITLNNKEISEIILYDIASRKLLQQEFINSASLNTHELAKGIYLYEVRNKNGVIKKGKVVKD
jgi:OOP family OmpA-OmpF porin